MVPLTDSMPKAMAPYRGSTLIAQGIEQLRPHIPHIHVTVGYRGAMLAEHVITHGASSVFNTEGHGNCWWIYNTFLSLLDEPVCVLTCDNVVDLDFGLLARDYEELDCPACMLVPVQPIAGLDGDYIFHENHIITRLDRHDPAPTYSSGIQVLNPQLIRSLTEEVEDFAHLWDRLIPQQQLRAARIYPKRWFSVDTIEQLKELALLPD
jgi:MurNAc alpha-1-phosphate uridylyltransferase